MGGWQPDEQQPTEPPKAAAPGQANFGEDLVVLPISKLTPGQGNYAAQSDVIVDHEGFGWIKADAKVYSARVAAARFPGEKLLTITKTAKGLGVILPAGKPGDWLWEPVQRASISVAVLPCMSLAQEDAAPPKKVKTDKGDGTFFGKAKGGQQ